MTKSRLSKHKMGDDTAEFSVYQKYKKEFKLEIQFAGTDFVLPPKTITKLFIAGLRPTSLREVVQSLEPRNLAEADQHVMQLLPQEQAFSARSLWRKVVMEVQ